jgi:hypothetical protein
MLGTPAFGNIDKSIAMTLWHRNCFKLKDAEFLTEEEWLARDDYRVVFRSSGFAASVEIIRQIDVHIFTDQEPFQELDLIPNEYSPALHCIPNKTVGGFVFDSGVPDQYFILYDYKDYYQSTTQRRASRQAVVCPAMTNLVASQSVIQKSCATAIRLCLTTLALGQWVSETCLDLQHEQSKKTIHTETGFLFKVSGSM